MGVLCRNQRLIVAAFEAQYTESVKGGAHKHFIDAQISDTSMKHCTSPALNGCLTIK